MEQYRGMEEQIASFPEQLEMAVEIGRHLSLPAFSDIQNVYIAGMGGSAIGGEFVRLWTHRHCALPIHIAKGYQVPAWVGPQTLAILSSFSGNTEETLTAFETVLRRRAQVVSISAGGKLQQYAHHHHIPHIDIPRRWISPRANLGLSSVLQYFILYQTGILQIDLSEEFLRAAGVLRHHASVIQQLADQMARALSPAACVYIIVPEEYASVGLRFRQQINENAKLHAAHYVIPEMHHNAIVGWKAFPAHSSAQPLATSPHRRVDCAPLCSHLYACVEGGHSHRRIPLHGALDGLDFPLLGSVAWSRPR